MLVNNIFIILRPDRQSIDGTINLLDNVYSSAINVIKSPKVRVDMIINQTPDVDEMKELIESIQDEIRVQFSFIQNYFTFEFNARTNYNLIINNLILPDDDHFNEKIQDVVDKVL